MSDRIAMIHGSGGQATSELIAQIFADAFQDPVLDEMEDSACVPAPSGGSLAVTTDSFVVTPLKYRGGDIGRLAVCGTVNDLLMRGAVPRYLTCGWVLGEGTDMELVREMAHSMAKTAREARIRIVAGDTKVIDSSAGIIINTAGVGFIPEGIHISSRNAQEGDRILVSGNLGDHHAAILAERMSIETDIASDNAPLTDMVRRLTEDGICIHTLRDVTRGGLGTVLKELAVSSGKCFEIEEEKLPVSPKTADFCALLGLDPVYMGNEGKLVAIVPADQAQRALEVMRSSDYGRYAALIGRVRESSGTGEAGAGDPGTVIMRTMIGGERLLDVLQGEGLPRIC